MSLSARQFFSEGEREDILLAIKNAELDTSGEIRVHVEDTCKGDVKDRAAFLFKKLGMHNTDARNGVLFYLAVKNRRFAILGDEGINKEVPSNFWDEICDRMVARFRNDEFADGLAEAISKAGQQLKKHFLT